MSYAARQLGLFMPFVDCVDRQWGSLFGFVLYWCSIQAYCACLWHARRFVQLVIETAGRFGPTIRRLAFATLMSSLSWTVTLTLLSPQVICAVACVYSLLWPAFVHAPLCYVNKVGKSELCYALETLCVQSPVDLLLHGCSLVPN